MIAPHFELFQHHLLLVGVDDKLLDIFGEHCQSLILLRIGEPPSKFDVLWIYHNRVLLSTRGASGARLQTLSLIETGTSTVHFTLLGEACHECWAEHFVLLRANLTPRVLQDLLRSEASLRRLMEQLLEEEACWRRDMVWELKLLRTNILVELLVVLASEREFAAEKGVEKDTECPDISRRPRVLDFTHDFGSHVRGRATEDLDFPVVRYTC